jgi:hypoxanthine phosphoribosyltransferase
MQDLSFKEIVERINKAALPDIDLVVGIADGGVVPASLIASRLKTDLRVIKINYRDPQNNPQYESPVILSGFSITHELIKKKILIVDDVSVSGKTFQTALNFFNGFNVKTLALKGKTADYVLFPEISECVNWPWKIQSPQS